MEYIELTDKEQWRMNGVIIGAVENNNLDAVKDAKQKGASLFAKDPHHNSPLSIAIRKGFTEIVDYLIETQVFYNDQNRRGETALMHASSKGDLRTVNLLIAKGADILRPDNEGNRAYEHATDEKVASVLLEAMAEVTSKNFKANIKINSDGISIKFNDVKTRKPVTLDLKLDEENQATVNKVFGFKG